VVGRVIKRFPHLVHGRVQALIEIYKCAVRPEMDAKFIARNQFARTSQQDSKDFERLTCQFQRYAIVPDLVRSKIHFEGAKAHAILKICHRKPD